jgi:hypothetical protein
VFVLGALMLALRHRRREGATKKTEIQSQTAPTGSVVTFGALLTLAVALLALKFLYLDSVSNPLVAHYDGVTVGGISQPRDVVFGGAIQLLGFDLNSNRVKSGDVVKTTLYLRTVSDLDENLSTFVHLTAPGGFVLAQKDNLHPANLPTSQWDTDAYVADEHAFTVPLSLAPGEYELRAGLYDPNTSARWLTSEGKDYILLQRIVVTE